MQFSLSNFKICLHMYRGSFDNSYLRVDNVYMALDKQGYMNVYLDAIILLYTYIYNKIVVLFVLNTPPDNPALKIIPIYA